MRIRSTLAMFSGWALLNGCMAVPDYSDHIAGMAEKAKGAPPESVWNNHGIWLCVYDAKHDYIPIGYSKNARRSENEGTWIIDKRPPGKRLFVPYAGAGEYSFGVLRGEAISACNWTPRSTIWHIGGGGGTFEFPDR